MAAAGFFTVVTDVEVENVPVTGRLTVKFQHGGDYFGPGDLETLGTLNRTGKMAKAVGINHEVELPTDIAGGGDPADSLVGYDLTWFNNDTRITALFPAQPANSTVYLSDLVSSEPGIPPATSAVNVAEAKAARDEAVAAAASASAISGLTGEDDAVAALANSATSDVYDALQAGFAQAVNVMHPRWGVENDGTGNQTAALQAVINAVQSAGGGTIFFPPGTYKINSTLTVTSNNVRLIGSGATIDATGMPNEGALSGQFALKAYGTQGSTVAITSNLAAGATTVETTTATFTAGDLVLITSNQDYVDGTDGSKGNRGALHRVASITDADTLVLTEPSFFSYATASTATIRKVTPLTGFHLEGFTFIGGGAASLDHCGVQVQYADNPVIRDVTANRFRDTAIQLRTVWGGLVENSTCADGMQTMAGQTGYGVSILDASRHTLIRGCHFRNSRHGVTGGGTIATMHVTTRDCDATEMLAAAFDSHEECWWWTFENCVAVGGSIGFGMRGMASTVRGCSVRGTTSHGVHVRSYDINSSGLLGGTVVDCVIADTGGNGLLWEGTTDCRILGGLIRGNQFRRNGDNNLTVWLSDNLTIGHNEFDTTVNAVGNGGNNVRLVGTSSSSRCTNVLIQGGAYRNAVNRWLRADFTEHLTIDAPFIVTNNIGASILNSCTNTRVVADPTGPAAPVRTQSTNTDSSITMTPLSSSPIRKYVATMTADRTITLSTNNIYTGCRFRVVRTGPGAFNLSVGGLKNLVQNTWCDVEYDGGWALVGYGTL